VSSSPLKLVTQARDHENWKNSLPGRFRLPREIVSGGLTPHVEVLATAASGGLTGPDVKVERAWFCPGSW
jgi:hypothetical protein